MAFINLYGSIGILIFSLMILLWLLSLLLKNSSIVDIFWGSGFVIATWAAYFLSPQLHQPRQLLLNILVTVWGFRLSFYILWRNWGKAEDFRYQTWRKEAGRAWWWRSFFKVFLLQGLLLWVIATPLIFIQSSRESVQLIWVDYIAILLWFIGFFFEAVGDWQLARFKNNPANKGKVLQSGVWRYTRHPNYFGDSSQWWAYYLIALAAGGWWTIFSPVIMTALLLRVSGVTLLEKTLKEAKPGYKEYVETTSEFFPWFPRKKGAK